MPNTNDTLQNQIVGELAKLGWQPAADNDTHAVIARYPVQTFRGEDFVEIRPILRDKSNISYIKASFISAGHNVLASCCAYLSSGDNLPEKIASYHADILDNLKYAYSIRVMASLERKAA